MGKLKILFLCTGNSCRSQITEGWVRHLKAKILEPYSAGVHPKELNPLAVKVMAELGVDLSKQKSKCVDEFKSKALGLIITVCGNVHEICPTFPAKIRIIHAGFDDPPLLAKNARTEEGALVHYRRVRDEICDFVQALPKNFD